MSQAFFALIPGSLFMLVFVWRASWTFQGERRFTLFDDALISMAYGRTLAQTGEFVWFPGADRVQGVTNPLWSLIMALVHFTGLDGSSAALTMSVIGFIIMLITAAVVMAIISLAAPHITGIGVVGIVAGGCVTFLYPLTFWTLRGMEVGLLALLSSLMVLGVVLVVSAPEDSRRTVGFVLVTASSAIGILTRIDFLLVTATCFAFLVLYAGTKRRRLQALGWIIFPLAVLIGVLVFQHAYWGDILPNTYRLKMEGIPLLERVVRGIFAAGKALPALVLAFVATLVVLQSSRDMLVRRVTSVLISIIVLVFGYSVWVGGDAWEWSLILNRYLATSLPLILCLAFLAFAVLTDSKRCQGNLRWPALVLVASGFGLGLVPNPISLNVRLSVIGLLMTSIGVALCWWGLRLSRSNSVNGWLRISASLLFGIAVILVTSGPGALLWVSNAGLNVREDQQFVERSIAISEVTKPEARVAVMWAGAPGYYSHRPLIDMFGKSDRKIASLAPRPVTQEGVGVGFVPGHNKWNYELSIHDELPDMVFQLNNPTAEELTSLRSWGYLEGCFADGWHSYFLKRSTQINWSLLVPCQ